MKKIIDVIWNITRICAWKCANCCVDAVEIRPLGDKIIMRSEGLANEQVIVRDPKSNAFDQALIHRQKLGLELDLAGKLKILDNLAGFDVKLDFSGGDVLLSRENFQLLKEAALRFGRENITLTATGMGLYRWPAEDIAPHIGEFNFSYDNVVPKGNKHRQAGYASGNLNKATDFVQLHVPTRAECPLSTHNISEQDLIDLYKNLHGAGIKKLLLMRLFPSGRGALTAEDIPTPEQYREAIAVLRRMEAELQFPKVRLQCALRHFDNPNSQNNPCDLMHESFGLMWNGNFLLSPWAIDKMGRPLDESWVLGNLARTPLEQLLNTAKAQAYLRRLDENHGHCKIFSFLHSKKPNREDRIFDQADPLVLSKENLSLNA